MNGRIYVTDSDDGMTKDCVSEASSILLPPWVAVLDADGGGEFISCR